MEFTREFGFRLTNYDVCINDVLLGLRICLGLRTRVFLLELRFELLSMHLVHHAGPWHDLVCVVLGSMHGAIRR